ncbi:cell wall-binding repeat-containing protein [Tepidibacillus fermentans]|uniref:N-acetylmuramoyl-L-alanine amidase n=1 Tax=Tepidibacillus fermentans TaxID=1281767 RepID=A0A4V2USY8_9BACI|nr:cell wall-binding repeat-containing protein [Tepidibacillus fermentans]TCS83344.1 N-acetylmuramoyl-L-alanine amidase [Tepidibacillus fermentans]
MRKSKVIILLLPLFFILFSTYSFAQELTVDRLAGKDRFETAVEVSKKGWSSADTVILAHYNGYADALTATPLAYKQNGPILLTETNRLTPVTKSEIQRLHAKNVIIVGGDGVVSPTVANELKNMNINVKRLGGKDRFDTALQIAQQLGTVDTSIIAYGRNFPDALTIGSYAAQNGYPILLVEKDTIPTKTAEALREKNIKKTIIVGGPGVISSNVYNKIPSPRRIYGNDRFGTAVAVVKNLNMSTAKMYIATGMNFADALTGAVLAAKENAPLLLTYKDKLPTETLNLIKEKKVTTFTILGGTGVVSNTLLSKTSLSILENSFTLAGKIIVLDAGHGPFDPGADGVIPGYDERDFNLQLVNRIAEKLKEYNPTLYIAPRDTSKDSKQSLKDRVDFANSKNADLFISIHHDSSTNPNAQGISTHYSSYRPGIAGSTDDAYVIYSGKQYPFVKEEDRRIYFNDNGTVKSASVDDVIVYDPTPTEAAQKSKILAERLAQDISALGFKKAYTVSGARDHNLYVTRWTNMPSVLIENGFISNPDEAKKVTDPTMQDKIAQVIVNHILEFFKNK